MKKKNNFIFIFMFYFEIFVRKRKRVSKLIVFLCLFVSRYHERVKIHFEKLILGDEDVR